MKTLKKNKARYIAPEMKSTAFHAEHGYAASVTSASAKITMTNSNL